MEKITLEKREVTGKKAKRLLKDRLMPGVVYNSKGESHTIQLDASVAIKTARDTTSTTIIDAVLDGKDIKVILKETDKDPRTDALRHVSFFQVDEGQVMSFTIPFEVVGVAPAVKNNIGVLVNTLLSLDVRCKPADLVSTIKIDISELEHPGQLVSVSEIELPKGIELPNDDQLSSSIVTISDVQKALEALETETGEEDIEPELDEDGNPIEPTPVAEGEDGEASAVATEPAE